MWLLTTHAYALDKADWLYVVEQPVEAQSDEARSEAARASLLVVLSRLSGLASVPRNEQVRAALARPADYYDRFVFFDKRENGRLEQTMVRFTFSAAAIQALLDRAALPVWWDKRPKIMLWMVLDNRGQRDIVDAAMEHPMVQALQARAKDRGLELILPLMDLDDNMAVSAADVWGKVGQSLDAASQRYDADLVFIGRVSRVPTNGLSLQPYRGDWEVWVQGQPLAVNFNANSAPEAAALGIDMLVDRLAEIYAVLPRAKHQIGFAVTGLKDGAHYASFMRYVEAFEFVDEVVVTGIDSNALRVQVSSRAQADQLLMLLTSDNRLTQDRLYRGLERQLIWQG